MSDLDQSPAVPYNLVTEGPTIGPVKNYNPSSGTGTPGGADGNVQYNQAGAFGGLTNAQLTTKINVVGSATSGAAPASGGGTANFLRADGTFAQPLPQPATITYSMIQNVSTNNRFLGRITSGAGSVEELTGTQAATFIDLFTSSLRGSVPGSGGGTTNFLRADGVWVSPGSSGSPGGASGQVQFNNAGSFGGVTVIGDATLDTGTGIITIANDAVTYAKMQNIVANNVVLGNISGANQNTAELTGTQVTALLDAFTTSLKGVVPASGGGSVNFLRADGTWVPPPGGSGGTPGGALNTIQWNSAGTFAGFTMNGDATLVPSTGVITVANQAITYAKIQNVSATSRFLGRITAGAGSAEELTGTQATTLLDNFTTVLKGIVPASGGGTTNFLRADGTWVAPGGAGAPGGVNGQVQYNNAGAFGGFTVGGDATLNTGSGVLTISNLAVTYAKMQNVVNNNRILGNVAGAAQPVVELTGTQATTVLDQFTNVLKGVVPGSGGGTTNFLRADGTWAAPGGAGAPGGTTLQLQYNNAGAFAGMSGTSWDNTNRSLTLTGATVTTSNPIENYTQIWNAGAITFTGLNYNFTDTASSVNSRFVAYQIGGVDKYVVRKDGSVTSGIWLGTPVDAPRGGTGQSGYAIGDTLYASSTTALSKLPGNITTTRRFLTQTGTGAASQAPVWGVPTRTFVNVLDYGADPTGVATSDIAFGNAYNAVVSGGAIYIPSGTYKLSTPWLISANNIEVFGDGWASIIRQSSLTSNVITNSGSSNFFRDMTLTYSSQASAGIALQNGTGAAIFNSRVSNLNILNCWNGIKTTNENIGYYSTLNIVHGAIGFQIQTSSNIILRDYVFTGVAAPTANCYSLYVFGNSSGCVVSNGECFAAYFPLFMGGSSGGIGNNPNFCKFNSVYFDSGTREAFISEAYECTFVNCWYSNGRNVGGAGNFPGVTINAGSGLKFIGCEAYSCGSHGFIVVAGVKNTIFSGCSAISNSITAGSGVAHGFTISANVTDFAIRDCVAKNDTTMTGTANQGWGIIVVAGTSDRYIVQGNLISTNVTGGVSDAGTGVNKLVANNY